MSFLITGASGLIGRALVEKLDIPPWVTSRNSTTAGAQFGNKIKNAIDWNPTDSTLDIPNDCSVVVNLMGESIASGRWTQQRKKSIYDSRVIGTRNLVRSLAESKRRPAVLVSGSAVGIYPDANDEWQDESSPRGSGFLAELAFDWEQEALRATELGIRVVLLRTGIVLSTKGGALKEMLPIFRWGGGATLGNGRQWMPWIHIDDIVGLIKMSAELDSVYGPLNGVSPSPVTNRDFTKTLARCLHRPALLRAPKFALKLMLGEFAESLVSSQRVSPKAAIDNGYTFSHPELEAAIKSLLSVPK